MDENTRDKIDHLLNASLKDLVDPVSLTAMHNQSRSVIDNLANEEKMDRFREEMIGCLKLLLESRKDK